jgi:hypothetical protein
MGKIRTVENGKLINGRFLQPALTVLFKSLVLDSEIPMSSPIFIGKSLLVAEFPVFLCLILYSIPNGAKKCYKYLPNLVLPKIPNPWLSSFKSSTALCSWLKSVDSPLFVG